MRKVKSDKWNPGQWLVWGDGKDDLVCFVLGFGKISIPHKKVQGRGSTKPQKPRKPRKSTCSLPRFLTLFPNFSKKYHKAKNLWSWFSRVGSLFFLHFRTLFYTYCVNRYKWSFRANIMSSACYPWPDLHWKCPTFLQTKLSFIPFTQGTIAAQWATTLNSNLNLWKPEYMKSHGWQGSFQLWNLPCIWGW